MSRVFDIDRGDGSFLTLSGRDLPLRIGVAENAHIRLTGLNGEICLIGEIDRHLFLQPTSDSVAIFHNSEKIARSVWIKSGDTTRIGRSVISYDISGDIVTIRLKDAAAAKAPRPEPPPARSESSRKPLPRVSTDANQGAGLPAWMKIAIALLVLLSCAAAFLLAAVSLEIEISPPPGHVHISGLPPALTIGGRLLAIPGSYTVQAEKGGYQPLRENIRVDGANRRFAFKLVPLAGRVDLATNPEKDAEIGIDGRPSGTSPLLNIELSAGNHTVEVTKERYRKIQRNILVEGRGIHQNFTFTLQPAWGEVTLTSKPKGAKITVDGKDTGMKTPATLELTEGTRAILLDLEGYQPGRLEISVKACGHISPPAVSLRQAPALLRIVSVPAAAMVVVDGAFKGRTPLILKLASIRQHKITITAPGNKAGHKKISLEPGGHRKISFKLEPQYSSVFVNTAPSQSEIFIDGRPRKNLTGSFRLLAMPHTIEARAAGYKKQVKRITPIPGNSITVDMRLQPLIGNGPTKDKVSRRGLVLLQPGRFTMGSPRGEAKRRSNEGQRRVEITRPFYIAAREVTNGEYRMFKANHSSGSFKGHSLNGNSQPVVNVTFADAARYLNWLSERDGLKPFYLEKDGKITVTRPLTDGYRLATEAEWAFAARFVRRAVPWKYPWNGAFPPRGKDGNFADESARAILPSIISGYDDTFPVSSPVGSFNANPAGLFDMGGNVSEWCHDFYSPIAPGGAGVKKDPMGPPMGTHHVVRGASWKDASITELRLGYRGYSRKAMDDLGFRVARYAR